MIDIICFSTTPWDPIPTRKQQIMKRMPESCRIFYLDPPVTYIGPLKDPSLKPYLTKFRKSPKRVKENLFVFALPPIMPFYNRKRSINKFNQKMIARFVKEVIYQNFDLKSPIIWTYMPNTVDLLEYLPYGFLVYDCIDKHSEFQGFINKQVVEEMEDELAKKSNVVFTTAEGLYNKLKNLNPKTYLVPNGAEFEHFNKAATKAPVPESMKNIPHPIFGFVGVIHTWIDTQLIEYLASKRKDWSFVLIGPVGAGVSVDNLKKYKNVYMLGRIDHQILPQYVAQFDVCLNLFKINKLSENVSPLKFYEYLATGKPIVSTSMPQVEEFPDVVYIGKDYDEVLQKCEEAISELKDGSNEKMLKRVEYARLTSWDSRVSQIIEILKREGIYVE
ncbi:MULTISPECIES: glycosyltransferase [unclassified Caldicellulosiruptor]|uniref:glycosyltransferase n=1 Tax=unclassified Caldicellulosiruptor TaxID=2622462 RepID=UPI00039C78FF|nr:MULTISPECIES: glycosyltransferase [unclassified Caldicellulosiruptor]